MKKLIWLAMLALSLMWQSVQAEKQPIVIAIDAGHGGKDPGAIGQKGYYEKDIVLSISKKLQVELERYHGLEVHLIRADDTYFTLLERRDTAEKQYGADMFLSIHADSFKDRSISGASIFVLSEHDASSARARYLAEIQSDGTLQSSESTGEILDIVADITTRGTLEHNAIAAKMILKTLSEEGVPLSRNVPEYADFGVLKSSKMLALLIETGFISNSKDELHLVDQSFQSKVAKAIAKAVYHYYQQFPVPDSIYDKTIRVLQYTVAKGDSLYSLARKFQVTVQELKQWNQLSSSQINIGQILEIQQ